MMETIMKKKLIDIAITADIKQVISLSCLADSHPPATITWYQLTPNKQVILVISEVSVISFFLDVSSFNVFTHFSNDFVPFFLLCKGSQAFQ